MDARMSKATLKKSKKHKDTKDQLNAFPQTQKCISLSQSVPTDIQMQQSISKRSHRQEQKALSKYCYIQAQSLIQQASP
jgi:hypothetical protein